MGAPPQIDIERTGRVTAAKRRYRGCAADNGFTELADEVPIALEYNGISHAVMLATPCDLEDFALGFSLSEGIVERPSDIFGIKALPSERGITLAIDVAAQTFARLKERRRTLTGRTGCGICGTESLDQVLRPLPSLAGRGPRIAPAALVRAGSALPALQPLQRATGATHGAAWCTADGAVVLAREDVGRHNALDKLIGALLRANVDLTNDLNSGFALITSRASVEMVQKSATAGIAVLAAVSAPTSLAVRIADECGQTLIGFARGEAFSVYGHAQRITS